MSRDPGAAGGSPCTWRCFIILGALLLGLEGALLLELLVALLLGLKSALLLEFLVALSQSGKSRDSLRLDAPGERLAGHGLSV